MLFVGGVDTGPVALVIFKDPALARDILKKSAFLIDFRSQKIQGLTLEVLFIGGVDAEPVALVIFQSRAPARDIRETSRAFLKF